MNPALPVIKTRIVTPYPRYPARFGPNAGPPGLFVASDKAVLPFKVKAGRGVRRRQNLPAPIPGVTARRFICASRQVI
jgi:hypothetical protein